MKTPLNYTGNKSRLIDQFINHFPDKVIRAFRNHMVLKYTYGARTKECFWVRSQLFEGQEVHFLRFVQGIEDGSWICPVSAHGLWKTEILEARQNRDCNRTGVLSTAAGIPSFE